MLNILLIAAGSAAFIGAVAKILDLPLKQPRPPSDKKKSTASSAKVGAPQEQEAPPTPTVHEPKSPTDPSATQAQSGEAATSKIRSSWRLLLLILMVAIAIAALIVALAGWIAAFIEKALA